MAHCARYAKLVKHGGTKSGRFIGVFLHVKLSKIITSRFLAIGRGDTPKMHSVQSHAGVTPIDPQMYAKVEGWRTPEVQRSKGLHIEICILLRQHAKEYSFGYIHAVRESNSMPEFRA